MKRILSIAVILLLIACTHGYVTNVCAIKVSVHVENSMWIEPEWLYFTTGSTPVGSRFNVTLWLWVTADNMFVWQFKLYYDTMQLKATRAGYTAGTQSEWATYRTGGTAVTVTPVIEENYVMFAESCMDDYYVPAGTNASLAWVEFEIIKAPPEGGRLQSRLNIDNVNTWVLNLDLDEIPITKYGATYVYEHRGAPTVHDIAIIDVVASPTTVRVGEEVHISVGVYNKGTATEYFDVETFYDSVTIGVMEVSLAAGMKSSLEFVWVPKTAGTFTISARAGPVPGETNAQDNVFVDGKVTVMPMIERKVGVKVGDYVQYETVFKWLGTTPMPPAFEQMTNIDWVMINVTGVSGSIIYFDGTVHFKNGTKVVTHGISWDINPTYVYPIGPFWFIGANLNAGDLIYPYSQWKAVINETVTRTYARAPRDANHFTGTTTQYDAKCILNCYWDKESGILVEHYSEITSTSSSVVSTAWSIYLMVKRTNIWKPAYLPAKVEIAPKSLNLESKGKQIIAIIYLPNGYKAKDVIQSSITLNDTVKGEMISKAKGATFIIVKFDRESVINYILSNIEIKGRIKITLTITGELNNGKPFQDSDTITIILPIPRCSPKCWRFMELLEAY
jgi:hypothetical protein